MTHITIITDAADIARHQANVDAFLADRRNQSVFQAFADADLDEDLTDIEIVDLVAEVCGLRRADAIERLAKIDIAALREVAAP
jgi:hypothetical protein